MAEGGDTLSPPRPFPPRLLPWTAGRQPTTTRALAVAVGQILSPVLALFGTVYLGNATNRVKATIKISWSDLASVFSTNKSRGNKRVQCIKKHVNHSHP